MTTQTVPRPEAEAAPAPAVARNRRLRRPLADIVETPEEVRLTVEMPGVGAEDVEVTLERRVLTIRARCRDAGPETLRLVHAEYEPGDYERAFTLSETFDATRIEASVQGGVLTLRLPRSAEARPRRIEVRAG